MKHLLLGLMMCAVTHITAQTVTSVNLTMPSTFCSTSSSNVSGAVTLTCTYASGQTPNLVFGTNSSGNVGLMNLTTVQLPVSIPLSSLAQIPANSIIGNPSSSPSVPSSLTPAQANSLLQTVTTSSTTNQILNGPLQVNNTSNVYWVDGTVYPNAISACAAAGNGGAVIIPPTYAGADTCQPPTGATLTVVDNRPSRKGTYYLKRDFGARGELTVLNDVTTTAGNAAISSTSKCFGAADVGKLVQGLAVGGSGADSAIFGKILTTSSCTAMLDSTVPVSRSGSGVFIVVSDDTIPLTNFFATLSAVPGSQGFVENGVFMHNSATPLYLTTTSSVVGSGSNNSFIAQWGAGSAGPADLLIVNTNLNLKSRSYLSGGIFASSPFIEHLAFAGLGVYTTGNLLTFNGSMGALLDVAFLGHGGRAYQTGGERMFLKDIVWSAVRQGYVTGPYSNANESYLDNWAYMGPGVASNPWRTVTSYSYSRNAINGVIPSTGNLVQDTHAGIEIYGTANNHISHGSIKPTNNLAAIKINNSTNSEVSHTYCESAVNSGVNPCFIIGGVRTNTTLQAAMGSSDLTFDVSDGSWFLPSFGTLADLNNFVYPGLLAPQMCCWVIYPPDYVFGSTSASRISTDTNQIQQGNFEYIDPIGIVHDGSGTTYHVHVATGGRGVSSTGVVGGGTSYAWPANAVVEMAQRQGNQYVQLESNHNVSVASSTAPHTLTCNADAQQTCGSIIVGDVADTFFYPTATNTNYSTTQESIMLAGTGSILTSSYAVAATTTNGSNTLTSVSPTSQMVRGNLISGPGIPNGTFITGISGTTVTLSQQATVSATNATLTQNSSGIECYTACTIDDKSTSGTNTNTLYPGQLGTWLNGIAGSVSLSRIVYSTGIGASLSFYDSEGSFLATGDVTNVPIGFLTQYNLSLSGQSTAFTSFSRAYTFGDVPTTASALPNHVFQMLPESSSTPGLFYKLLNSSGGYNLGFKAQGNTGQNSYLNSVGMYWGATSNTVFNSAGITFTGAQSINGAGFIGSGSFPLKNVSTSNLFSSDSTLPGISGCGGATMGANSTNVVGSIISGITGTCTFTITWHSNAGITLTHGNVCGRMTNVTTAANFVDQTALTTTTGTFSGTTNSGDVMYYHGCVAY